MKRRLIGAATILALAGCGGNDAPGGGSSGAEGPPAMTIVTNEGRAEIRTGGSASANLPDGIPAYPGADTTGGMTITGGPADGSGGGAMTSFRTADAPARVVEFYAAAAERAGYRVAARMTMGPNAALTAEKEGGGFHVNALQTGNGTMVQLVVGRDSER